MNPPSIESKSCSCGEQVPSNCVRCRFCGEFLYEQTKQFHAENIGNDDGAVWMVAYGGQTFGPVNTTDLSRSVAVGQTPSNAMVWKQGLSGWIEICRVAELQPAIAQTASN